MRSLLRVFAIIMAVLFVISAVLQYNDPDPLAWVAVYLAGAAVLTGWLRGKSVRLPAALLAAVCLGWAMSLFPGFWGSIEPGEMVQAMKAERPQIEESREAGGLLILAVTMLPLVFQPRRRGQGAPERPVVQ